MITESQDEMARRIAASLRRRRGALSRFQLGARAGVTEQTIYRIEHRKGGLPDWSTLDKLAQALDVTLGDLLEVSEEDSDKRALFNGSVSSVLRPRRRALVPA